MNESSETQQPRPLVHRCRKEKQGRGCAISMRRRSLTTPTIELLRRTTYRDVYGELTDHCGVRPSVTRDQYLQRRLAGFHLPRLANYKFEQHFKRGETFYFFGNPSTTTPYTMALIDIDVQKKNKKGSATGARAFAEHLRTYWPTLSYEASSGGQGLGIPIFVRKKGRSAKEVNVALKRLDAWLKFEAQKVGADIENVEVKGHLPVITWKDGFPDTIQYGQFARYPRTLTYAQLTQAPVLSAEEWLLAELPQPQQTVSNVGSVGPCISDDDLSALPAYANLYRRMASSPLKANSRFLVTAEDFSIACVLLRFFKQKPNKGKSLPMRRVEAVWTELYIKGKVKRPWNHHRFKRIRDFLSELGHIDWIDNRYQTGEHPRACKWCITDEFYDLIEQIHVHDDVNTTGRENFVDTVQLTNGGGRNLRPQLALVWEDHERDYWSKVENRLELLFAA